MTQSTGSGTDRTPNSGLRDRPESGQAPLPQNRSYHPRRKIHEHALDCEDDAAGGGQEDEGDVDELEQGDAEDGLDEAGADEVGLRQPDLLRPAAHVESVGEAQQEVDNQQEIDGELGLRVDRVAPREQGEGEDGDAVGRQGDGVVAEPAAAVGDVAVGVIDLEAVDLPEEEQGEEQVRELVRELHQPMDIRAHARDQEQDEEHQEPPEQALMEPDPAHGPELRLQRLYQHPHGDGNQHRQHDTGQDIPDDAQRFPYVPFRFHGARCLIARG